jgi:hypothetical protein
MHFYPLIMKKAILILAISLACFGCKDERKTSAGGSQPFFLFDRIDYYHSDITMEDVLATEAKDNKSRKDIALLQIVRQHIPVNMMDTLFIRNMDSVGFRRRLINPAWNSRVSNLYSEREATPPKQSNCVPVFRDVLIFRQGNKITGMSKVDFDCGMHYTAGARYDASGFGQSGEYRPLYKILKQNQ